MHRTLPWLILLAMSGRCHAGADGANLPANSADFARDVVPVLTKAGCSTGACHGSFQGRGGFRLSLLGYDPAADYDALVKDGRGRRFFPAAPEQSLLLRKPTLELPHGGGRRLDRGSAEYRILHDWIAQGTPPPRADVRVVRLEVAPAEVVLSAGEQAALRVTAHWSDGATQDASPWALYESRDERAAEVTPAGRITSTGPGRVAVTVRYLGQVAAVPVTTPFGPAGDAPTRASRNFIDTLVTAEWRKLGLTPAPEADDAEFVRRVYLDLIGTLPTPDETRRFIASAAADRRALLIDELLARPEYADFWSLKWSDLLRAHRRALGEKGLASFHGWLKNALRENRPFDQTVRELLTAEGNLYTRGPVAFYFVDKTPEELAETTAQVFLGVRLQCAKCHHHPFEVWSQDDYYGLAAFFARLERKDTREGGAFGGAQSVKPLVAGSIRNPTSGREIAPAALGWPLPADSTAARDIRAELAAWVTRPANPHFARNIVNRYWGYLLGRGLVDPIDDLSATNPPLMPAVLDALAADFTAHQFDLKHLLRTIARSAVYQRASEIAPARDEEGRFFTHRVPRRLPAEVLLDAINQAAGTTESFRDLPPGMRAIALADSAVDSYFLNTFGRPKRTTTCECERGGRPDLSQALHLANSETIHAKVTHAEGRVARLLAAGRPDAAILDELYLAALCRLPDEIERQAAADILTSAASRQEAFEDLLWALLNCPEFTFSH
jgi:hypothetical protein